MWSVTNANDVRPSMNRRLFSTLPKEIRALSSRKATPRLKGAWIPLGQCTIHDIVLLRRSPIRSGEMRRCGVLWVPTGRSMLARGLRTAPSEPFGTHHRAWLTISTYSSSSGVITAGSAQPNSVGEVADLLAEGEGGSKVGHVLRRRELANGLCKFRIRTKSRGFGS